MTAPLLLVGVAALAAGTLRPFSTRTARRALGAQVLGAVLLAAGAAWVLATGEQVGAGFTSAIAPSFGLDPLSAFFVVLVGATAVPALLAARDGLAHVPARRTLVALTGAFVLT